MPEIVYGQDYRLIGAAAVVAARSDTRLILASPTLSKLITVAFTGTAPNVSNAAITVQALSVSLSKQPKAITASATYILAAAKNRLFRTAHSVALDTDGYAITEFVIECDDPKWIVERNGFVYLPWSTGGVIVYTTGGVEVARYDGVLGETTQGAYDSVNNLLYLCDGQRARGVSMTVNADGSLSANEEFALTSCKDIVAVIPSETYLAIACRDRLALFTIASPTSPVFAGHSWPDYGINDMVKVGTNAWWIASDTQIEEQADRFDYKNLFAIYIATRGVFAISAISGRVIGEANFTATYPPDIVEDVNQPPTIDAGADQAATLAGTLTGTATDPEGDPLTYLWTVVSGPGVVTFGTPTALVTTFSVSVAGNYVFQLTVSDGTNTRTDTTRLIAANAVPLVNAGVDQSISTLFTATLAGSASDSDHAPSPLSYLWTQISGPGAAIFGTAAALTTGVTVPSYGTYVFQLAASDGAATSTDTISVTFSAAVNNPPIIDSISAAPTFFEGPTGSPVLTVTAHDPDGDSLTYTWTQVSGPAAASFATPTLAITTVNIFASGSYVFRCTVSDGRGGVVSADTTTILSTAYDFFNDFGTNNPPVVSSVIVGNILYCIGTASFTTDTLVNGANGTFQRRGAWAWDLTTGYITSWDPFRTNTGVSATTGNWIANASDSSGLFIAGSFTTINGTQRRGLLKVDYTTGASIDAFNRDAGSNATATGWNVTRVFTFSGKVYFSDTGNSGTPTNTLKVVNETTGALAYEHKNIATSADSPNNLGTSFASTYGFAIDSTGYYVAFVGFSTVFRTTGGNVTVSRIAKFDFSGNIITAFAPVTGEMISSGNIQCAAIGGGRIYVGGYDQSLVRYIAAFDKTTGAVDSTFNARGSMIHEAYTLIGYGVRFLEYVSSKSALLWSGGVYMQDGILRNSGGAMNAATGAALNLRPARFGKIYNGAFATVGSSDGTCMHYYAAGDAVINHLQVKPGTMLLAGDWSAPSRTVTYNPFHVGATSQINDAALIGNVLYMTGSFLNLYEDSGVGTSLGTAVARNQIGATDLSTGLVTSFWNGKAALSGGSAVINSCDIDAGNSKLFVAGNFTSIGGTAGRFGVARLDIAGSSVDAVFTTRLGTGAVAETYHLCRRFGGLLFLVRSNLDTPETTYKTVVLDASTLATLATHTTNFPVLDVAYNASTGDYWLCGTFTNVNGTGKTGVAKFNSSHALQSFALTFSTSTETPKCMLVYNGYLYCGGNMGTSGTVNFQSIKSMFAIDLATDLLSPTRSPASLTTLAPSTNGIWHMAVSGSNIVCCASALSPQWNNKFMPQTGADAFVVDAASLTVVDRMFGGVGFLPRKSIPVPSLGIIAYIFGANLASLSGAATPAGNTAGYLRVVRDVP